MKNLLIFLALLLPACTVSTTQQYNIAVKGGASPEENLKAAQVIGARVWNGELKSLIKNQIPELKDANLDKRLGIRYMNMSYSNGEKGIYIQCLFKNTGNEAVANKVIGLCKHEVEAEMAKYFHPAAS